MSDEAHFHLSGHVNKHNIHYWSVNNPQDLYSKPLHESLLVEVSADPFYVQQSPVC